VANNRRTVSIFDAYDLPVSLPYSFDCKIDGINEYRTQSMLTVPICNQRENVLGVMQIINAMDDDGNIIPFSDSDEPLIKHFATSAGLAMERAQTTRNILLRMVSMAEMRDPRETGSHVNRVAAYSMEIYEEWAGKKGIPLEKIEREKDLLRMAAMLHDVGKVAISDLILKKPSRLTLAEFEIMKAHTYLGARLFRDLQSDFDEVALEVALNHHEKWDGTGYPGLKIPIEELSSGDLFKKNIVGVPKKGEEIPLFGRIVAVADVFDALGSRRVYKQAWSEERVLEEVYKSSGSHFDPEIVAAFFSCHETLKTIAERYPDID
jgi:HD-GYP domain-containing protein (c-di-GMP phosphodiesterase class II)